MLVAIALAFFVNVNEMSLTRFYRDRLMEAFIPNMRPATTLPSRDKPATQADTHGLSATAPDKGRPLLARTC